MFVGGDVIKQIEPTLVIRTDSSHLLGAGHVMRTMSVADEFVRRGGRTLFVMRELKGHVGELVQRSGHDVVLLPVSSWDGWDGSADAKDTVEAISKWNNITQWLIIDHYHIDRDWEQIAARCSGSTLVVGGPPDRIHECEILHDQTLASRPESRWIGRVPTTCRLLLGPQYALIRNELSSLRPSVSFPCGDIRRVLVTMGGSDPLGVSLRVTEIANHVLDKTIALDLVLGPQNQNVDRLEKLATSLNREVRILINPENYAGLILSSDLVVTGGGVSLLEMLSLGRPSVAIIIADNQRSSVLELARRGYCSSVDWAEATVADDLEHKLSRLTMDIELRSRFAECGYALIDGAGASRVVDAMLSYNT